RKAELLREAGVLLGAIAELAAPGRDPYTDADTLARAVELGLLDAPHLRGNAAACGKVVTRMLGGAYLAIDPGSGRPLSEAERVARATGRTVAGRILRGVAESGEVRPPGPATGVAGPGASSTFSACR